MSKKFTFELRLFLPLFIVMLLIVAGAPDKSNAASLSARRKTATPTLSSQPTSTPTQTPAVQATATLTPSSQALVILENSLPDGNVGTDYANFLSSSGGEGPTPNEWSLVGGRLPDGLSMTKSYGVYSTLIFGTPKTVQTTTFTVQVRDGAGHTTSKTFSITIHPPRPLVITNGSSTLAAGTVGTSYANSLFADGGIQPYSWAIVAGQLPPGLSLRGNVISGTPTTRGTFTFTARVTDNGGQQASQQFSITVN
jgi:hypothetical protein